MPGVKLQTAVADNVVGLEYRGVFNVGVVRQTPGRQEKRFHVLVNPVTHAGRVDADIGHVMTVRSVFDGVSLGAEVHSAPLVTAQECWNLPPGTAGGATTTHPALSPFCVPLPGHNRSTLRANANGRRASRMKVGPDFPAVHHARLQLAEREHGRGSSTNSRISRFWYSSGLYSMRNWSRSRQVTAAAHRIFHGDYLAVLPVCAQQAEGQIAVGQVDVHLIGFVAPTVEQRTGPERISTVCQAGWRGKIGLSPFL